MALRIDDFNGSEQEYVTYLEGEISRLRGLQRLSRCTALPWTEQAQSSTVASRQKRNTELQQFDTSETRPCHHPAKRSKNSAPTWKKNSAQLLKRTPLAENWWSSLRSEGIYEVMCNGTAVAFLLGDNSNPPVAQGTVTKASVAGDDLALLRHVALHAQSASQRRLTASVAIRLANFQQILVLSSCAVIRSIARPSVPQERLLDIVKICLGNVSDDYCLRMLDTAVFINRLIDILNAHGWDGRAAELLLWCPNKPSLGIYISFANETTGNRTPQYFYSLSRASGESLDHLRIALTKPAFIEGITRPQELTPFFLPGLVSQITRNEFQSVPHDMRRRSMLTAAALPKSATHWATSTHTFSHALCH